MKPARKAISTLRGEGTWGTTGGREQVGGQGPGRLQTFLPWSSGAPDLACTNEATPRGESPEATRPDPKGHTARYRRPHGRDSEDTFAHRAEDTLTHRLADPQRSESDRRPAEARTRQLCDHDALVPLPDRSIVLITLVSVRHYR